MSVYTIQLFGCHVTGSNAGTPASGSQIYPSSPGGGRGSIICADPFGGGLTMGRLRHCSAEPDGDSVCPSGSEVVSSRIDGAHACGFKMQDAWYDIHIPIQNIYSRALITAVTGTPRFGVCVASQGQDLTGSGPTTMIAGVLDFTDETLKLVYWKQGMVSTYGTILGSADASAMIASFPLFLEAYIDNLGRAFTRLADMTQDGCVGVCGTDFLTFDGTPIEVGEVDITAFTGSTENWINAGIVAIPSETTNTDDNVTVENVYTFEDWS